MPDVPPASTCGYSSRSELDRCLLALSFAALLVAGIAHIASYFGFMLIQSRTLQKLLTWILAALALWKIFGERRTATNIPRPCGAAMGVSWLYATILSWCLPIGQSYVWPGLARWLGLEGSDLLLINARISSAFQFAAALSLFAMLWFQPNGTTRETLNEALPKNTI
jgi:hypothetical protein